MKRTTLSCLGLAAVLLTALGCVQGATGGTAGTSIYVYDNASGNVLVWNDVNTLYDTPTAPPAVDATLTAGNISNMKPLAWGGMAVDPSHDALYLVAAAGGAVTCITQLSTQTGAVTVANDITTFNLGQSTDVYSGGSFGQAFVNPQTNTLYVTETNSDRTASRIWVVPSASATGGATVPVSSTIPVISNDMGFSGVAVSKGGTVYGYFPNGNTIYSNLLQNTPLDGGRIRAGSGSFSTLPVSNVVVGDLTDLSDSTTTFGTLAFDTVNNLLYCARQASSTATTPLPAVVQFNPGQFTSSNFNVAPNATLGDTAATLPNLRFITHAGLKDWLAGADMVSSAGSNSLYLWKAPSTGGSATTVTLTTGIAIGGIALDGNN